MPVRMDAECRASRRTRRGGKRERGRGSALRWELRNAAGEIVALAGTCLHDGSVVVRDTATLWAFESQSTRGTDVGLRAAEGGVILKHSISRHAASL